MGSINLAEFVLNPFTEEAEFDIESLSKAIHVVVRAMDDVLEENIERLPLEKQKEKSRDWRQIGIGHMGLADAFIKLGITYGSEESRQFSRKLGRFFINECVKATSLLAKERGSFPKFDHDSLIKSDFYIKNIDPSVKSFVKMFGMRNCALTSIAPTGSIGTMLGVSTGIEPNFRFSYTRKTESLGDGDTYFEVYAKIVEDYLKVHPQDKGNLPSYFVESSSISPTDRIELQSVWQEYIDTAISSTINLPESATIKDIEHIYIHGWRKGLKGVTVFRDNCERVGVLTTGKEEVKDVTELQRGEWKSLAEDTYYMKRNLTIGCGKLKLFVGISPSEGNIQDVYITKCGSGGLF